MTRPSSPQWNCRESEHLRETALLDEARWQIARVVGGATIAGGAIAGSISIGLAWIGRSLEQVRDALLGELVEGPSKPVAGGD